MSNDPSMSEWGADIDADQRPDGKEWVAWSNHRYYPSVAFFATREEAHLWCEDEKSARQGTDGALNSASVGFAKVEWFDKFWADH